MKRLRDELEISRALRGFPHSRRPPRRCCRRCCGGSGSRITTGGWSRRWVRSSWRTARRASRWSTRAKSAADFERAFRRRFGRSAYPEKAVPPAAVRALVRPPQGRAAAGAAVRPARALRVRACRADEGPRDPDGRGPALQLDRQGDRPPGRGAGRGDGAGEEPGAAAHPVPPRRAERRPDRPATPWAVRATSGRCSSSRARTRRRWRSSAPAGVRYLGNSKGMHYCYPTCGGIETLVESNTVAFHTDEEALAAGYHPCEDCRPLAKAS